MTEQTKDNGNNSIVADTNATDNRHKANGLAAKLVGMVIANEDKLSQTAKEYGHATFLAVKDGASLDMLIGEAKLAANWKGLTLSDSGKAAKRRLEQYFSAFRKVAEGFASLTDEQRNGIHDGTVSVLYVAKLLREAEAAATKAEKAAQAEAVTEEKTVTASEAIASLADTLRNMVSEASDDDLSEAYASLEALFTTVDARIAAATEAAEPEALAA